MASDPDITLAAVTARSAAALLMPETADYALPAGLDWLLQCGDRTAARGRSWRVPLFLDGLVPDTEYELVLPGRGSAATFRTRPCAGLVDVVDFGASPDRDDNADAFAEAVAAVPPGGTLRVPAGRFVTSPVFLKSRMTLHLAKDAVLSGVAGRGRYPILPARDSEGRMLGTWEGLPAACYASLLSAVDCTDVAITGQGTIDGGGDLGDWWTWPKETRDGARRPRTLFFSRCEGVMLSGVTVRNSPSWTIHPVGCRAVTAAGLCIENPPQSPNTDGLNPESCEDVLIAGVRFSVGDDCIAIKAGKRGSGVTDHLAPTRRVVVRNCRMERGHGGVVIGSEMSGGVTDVEVRRCHFVGTDRGLRIKTRRGRGGVVARVALTHCRMEGVPTPLAVNAFYFCDPDGKSAAVQSREPAPVDETTPHVSDISVAHLEAHKVQLALAALLGLPEAPIRGVRLSHVRAEFDPAAVAAPPLMACGVAPVRHAGILAEHAEVEASDIDLPLEPAVSRS